MDEGAGHQRPGRRLGDWFRCSMCVLSAVDGRGKEIRKKKVIEIFLILNHFSSTKSMQKVEPQK